VQGDTPKIWISAAEPSGDRLAASLLDALNAQIQVAAGGIAGPCLRARGVTPVGDINALSVMGLTDPLVRLAGIRRLFQRAVTWTQMQRPAAAVLVDGGEFHLRLGRQLRRHGVPVFFLAPPKLWAWGRGRIRRLRQAANAVGVLFPFEAPFYRARGLATTFVGHPAAALTPRKTAPPARLWLLPGSRPAEVRRHLPLMVAAAQRIADQLGLQPTVGRVEHLDAGHYRGVPAAWPVQILHVPEDLASGQLALAASGTVNLELAALGIPHVVVYRMHPLGFRLARQLVDLPWANPVNLVADADVVVERLQNAATPARIAQDLWATWQVRTQQMQRLADVAAALVAPHGYANAVAQIRSWL